ncbi:hypothetical protein ICM05_10805 [Leucobacter sp. cx-42]|uniref:hypothetical protein n=1 Tax=unclassified Leucobacter TaxID=2621730 RepID=UPI00165D3935|nr:MULTISPECIES: hypothetical protein [unclassified Leucobacter]MBC9955115.1 hypothetical protein [Leucobacter sp. cx-42]
MSSSEETRPETGAEPSVQPATTPLFPTTPIEAAQPVPPTQPVPPLQSAQPAQDAHRTGPRTGPIIWGALILAFCAYVGQKAFGTGSLDAITWITITTIGLGTLLLLVGITVVVRGRRT